MNVIMEEDIYSHQNALESLCWYTANIDSVWNVQSVLSLSALFTRSHEKTCNP